MIKNHKIIWYSIVLTMGAVVSAVVAAVCVSHLWTNEKNRDREIIALDHPIIYDDSTWQMISNLLEEGTNLVLYQEEKNEVISNPDFNRSASVDLIGIAGDTSVLYPGSNALLSGEEGYCLLGKKTAFELFGSSEVTGRTVKIKDAFYQVAGIAYGRDNICAYELDTKQGASVENMAFRFSSQSEQGMIRRKLKYIFY